MASIEDGYSQWIMLPDEELSVHKIQESLKPLNDDLWVTAACTDRLLEDVDAQRTLLQIGIRRTDNAVIRCKNASTTSHETAGEEFGRTQDTQSRQDLLLAHLQNTKADAQLCHMRGVLLERLDRLNTYVEICKHAPEQELDFDGEADDWEDDPWVDETAQSSKASASPSTTSNPPIPLSAFLTDSLIYSSGVLASHQWLHAIQALLRRHHPVLWPYRLAILDSIPEHVPPLQFRDILPALDPSTENEQVPTSQPWRAELDWSESPLLLSTLKLCDFSFRLESQPESILDGWESHKEPLTSLELSSWYQSRIDQVISSTGMVDVALATVQHGASQGIPGLDETGEELSLLSRLVYDAPQGENLDQNEDWTLTRWRAMQPISVVQAYLAHSSEESIAKDIARLVMPYLYVLEARAEREGHPDPKLPDRLLREFILNAPLDIVASIFEASKPTLPAAQRLIRNDEDIVRLALACLYGSMSLDQWPTMSRIFECMPAWDFPKDDEDESDAADTTILSLGTYVTPSTTRPQCTPSDLLLFFLPLPLKSLSRALDILDVHLESGEILARWSVPAPLRWFLQSHHDASEQRSWANRMARRAGGSEDRLDTKEDWEWLLEDMLKLSGTGDAGLKGAFGLLSRKEVMGIFLSGLLSTGKFSIAQALLQSKNKLSLDSQAVEDICLSCSHEFYDNASSGNFNFGDMKLAYECLSVPPSSARLQKEMEFIEATSRICSFNVMSRHGPISPIEIRLTKDRLSLVSRVLSSTTEAYKHTQVILDLVHKLGFRDDIVAEVKTLAMLSDTALQTEDFERAHETCERMINTVLSLRSSAPLTYEESKVQEASEVCWVACYQLGRQSEFHDVQKKLSLLGRALELCPPDQLHVVLTAWRRLETEDIEERKKRAGIRGGSSTVPPPKPITTAATSLATRLQDFRMPTAPLLSTPDAAALASRTFSRVAANFPFSVGSRGLSAASESDRRARSDSGSSRRPEGGDVQAQASRALQKGIGWLIGADDV